MTLEIVILQIIFVIIILGGGKFIQSYVETEQKKIYGDPNPPKESYAVRVPRNKYR